MSKYHFIFNNCTLPLEDGEMKTKRTRVPTVSEVGQWVNSIRTIGEETEAQPDLLAQVFLRIHEGIVTQKLMLPVEGTDEQIKAFEEALKQGVFGRKPKLLIRPLHSRY